LIDGNNVMGSRADGWWNYRSAAATRLTGQIAAWCRTHDDDVIVVFDRPVADETLLLAGGNLSVLPAKRAGRDAADDLIVELAGNAAGGETVVVTSDRGLRARLPEGSGVVGAGAFRDTLDA
jgi:hypothetical protein